MKSAVPLSVLLINSTSFASLLRKNGHQVVTAKLFGRKQGDITYNHGEDLTSLFAKCPAGFHADRIIYFDADLPSPTVLGLEDSPVGSIFISTYGHKYSSIHPQIGAMFDHVLYAQGDLASRYHHYNERSVWFPPWSSLKIVHDATRDITVTIHRGEDELLDNVREKFIKEVRNAIECNQDYGDQAEVYSRSKIVINFQSTNSLDRAIFDIMACGALALTPICTQGLCDLFKPEKNIILYREKDSRDAIDKIRALLRSEEYLNKIAIGGYNEVIKSHTEERRYEQLLDVLIRCTRTKRARRYYAASYAMLGEGRATLKRGDLIKGKRYFLRGAELLLKSLKAKEPFDDEVAKIAVLYSQQLVLLGENNLSEQLLNAAGAIRIS